jgi:hypothetical protein
MTDSRPLCHSTTAEAELDRLFRVNPILGARDRTRLKCFRSLLLKENISDLRDREGTTTRVLLEETLNRQTKQAQAVTVAKSTPSRRDVPSEPPRDDRPSSHMPDMHNGDPEKWHEFKKSFTAYMMSQSLHQ